MDGTNQSLTSSQTYDDEGNLLTLPENDSAYGPPSSSFFNNSAGRTWQYDPLSGVSAQQQANEVYRHDRGPDWSMGPPPLPGYTRSAPSGWIVETQQNIQPRPLYLPVQSIPNPMTMQTQSHTGLTQYPTFHNHTLPRTSVEPAQTISRSTVPTASASDNPFQPVPIIKPPNFARDLHPGWLRDTRSTYQEPTRIWHAIYRPGANGDYCTHPIHLAIDGTRELLSHDKPYICDSTGSVRQSLECWRTVLADPNQKSMDPRDLHVGDYTRLDNPTILDLPEGFYGGIARMGPLPKPCMSDHSDADMALLDRELYGWASRIAAGTTMYMCRTCMQGYNMEQEDASVFQKYGG